MSTFWMKEAVSALQALGYGDEISAGRFFMLGSGRISLAVAGNVRALITNPADSGRIIGIAGMVLFGTATSWASIYKNPDTGLPTATPRPATNMLVTTNPVPAAVVEVRVDTDAAIALSGGVNTGVVLGAGASDREQITAPFQIFPGQSIGVNVPFAGAADATLSGFISEKDV